MVLVTILIPVAPKKWEMAVPARKISQEARQTAKVATRTITVWVASGASPKAKITVVIIAGPLSKVIARGVMEISALA